MVWRRLNPARAMCLTDVCQFDQYIRLRMIEGKS